MGKRRRQTGITPAGDSKIVWDSAYPEAHLQAYPQALPEILYVGGSGCGHSIIHIVEDVCLICFFKDGFRNELPGRLHTPKHLADNGNPDQSPALVSHVNVVMGFVPPKPNQTMNDFRRARKQYTAPAHGRYPFTSALWELMSWQPPLATPLILAVSGEKEPKIAEKLNISIYNLQIRLQKGVKTALGFLRT